MKTVTIDRETLEFLTRMAIDSAITALDLQPELDAEESKIRAIASAAYQASQEAKAAK
jgi:myo-inositol catabolism protein IolC